MTHYKIKVQGISRQWDAATLEEAKLTAGKVWLATHLDNIYIDEYYEGRPTGVWYRKDGVEYIANSVVTTA